MTKLESDSIVSLVREYFEGPFGLSFFMAWIYATFYSTLIWVGESQGIASEYPWIISMATSGLIGIAGCLALGLKAPQPIRTRPWAFAGAAVACAIGTIAVASCSRADNPSPILVAVGAAVAAGGTDCPSWPTFREGASVTAEEAQVCQVDGDAIGVAHTMHIRMQADALDIAVPAERTWMELLPA